MTKLRRAAQVVEDLKTLGLITKEQVTSHSSLGGGLTVLIHVPKSDCQKYNLIKDLFYEEFSKSAKIIEDSEFLQIILI